MQTEDQSVSKLMLDDVPDMEDDADCWSCGGSGTLTDTCTCGDDTCCCLEPEEETCSICNGKGHLK